MPHDDPNAGTPAIEAQTETQTIRVVRAGDLMGPEKLLRIEHAGEVYTLRVTRNDKLILTK